MKIISWEDFITGKAVVREAAGITTGVFDGVHRGHVQLIEKLLSFPDTVSVLSTFTSNPFRYFFPERYPGDILMLDQKISLLESLGLDYLLLIDFSADFSKLSGRLFFHMLKERIQIRHLVLGRNHRCGHRGDTGAEDARLIMEPYGIAVDIVEPLVMESHPVSSTRIREALVSGNIEWAAKLIGRCFSLAVKPGDAEMREGKLHIPRQCIQQILPKDGYYSCMAGNEVTAEEAVLEIGDSELRLDIKKPQEVSRIEFLHTIELEG